MVDILDIDNAAACARPRSPAAEYPGRARRRRHSGPRSRCRAPRARQPARPGDQGRRLRATVGEMSDALERGLRGATAPTTRRCPAFMEALRWGERHRTTGRVRPVGGQICRGRRAGGRAFWSPSWARTATTAAPRWWPPAFADLGFDVDVGPLFQTRKKRRAGGRERRARHRRRRRSPPAKTWCRQLIKLR